ncbi:hypothetical protein M758_1G078400 [Ceratodon purpureus]|nr:hypothetical protein M758_1G078400 [Ceratodon purpureus]
MSRIWNFFVTRIVGLCQVCFRTLGLLPGPSYSRLLPESDLESQSEPLIASDHYQNGSAREQEYIRKTEELQQLQGERSRQKALIADLKAKLKEAGANSSSRVEELQIELQTQSSKNEELRTELQIQSGRIEELQTELQTQHSDYEERISNLEDELKENQQRIAELEDQLKRLQISKNDEIAAQAEEIQKLVKQLELAEHQNSADFAGGESFLDSGATPHLLNKVVERVNQTSGNFTKLLMPALKNGGVVCTEVAKALAPSVSFERAAHTKYVYQALVCEVLFADFESEYFNIKDNAPEILDPEQLRKENFQRYQQLTALENPEELVYEDAIESEFRKYCNKKQKDLIAALSLTGAPGVDDVGALIFGEVFGPDGIRRGDSAGTQSQVKVASAFVKFALSVFLVHKLSFSMHPIARKFRVKDAVEFKPEYMEPVVAQADSDDEDADSISLSVGFMVVPGFYVNRIVVHSRVYTVKRS